MTHIRVITNRRELFYSIKLLTSSKCFAKKRVTAVMYFKVSMFTMGYSRETSVVNVNVLQCKPPCDGILVSVSLFGSIMYFS